MENLSILYHITQIYERRKRTKERTKKNVKTITATGNNHKQQITTIRKAYAEIKRDESESELYTLTRKHCLLHARSLQSLNWQNDTNSREGRTDKMK